MDASQTINRIFKLGRRVWGNDRLIMQDVAFCTAMDCAHAMLVESGWREWLADIYAPILVNSWVSSVGRQIFDGLFAAVALFLNPEIKRKPDQEFHHLVSLAISTCELPSMMWASLRPYMISRN